MSDIISRVLVGGGVGWGVHVGGKVNLYIIYI